MRIDLLQLVQKRKLILHFNTLGDFKKIIKNVEGVPVTVLLNKVSSATGEAFVKILRKMRGTAMFFTQKKETEETVKKLPRLANLLNTFYVFTRAEFRRIWRCLNFRFSTCIRRKVHYENVTTFFSNANNKHLSRACDVQPSAFSSTVGHNTRSVSL